MNGYFTFDNSHYFDLYSDICHQEKNFKNIDQDFDHAFQLESPHMKDHKWNPHLLFFISTHGDEACGTMATTLFYQHLKENKISLKRGKITFLMANPLAFQKNVRYVDEDLNRAFLKEGPLTYEKKRSQTIHHFINHILPVDFIMDIHSVSCGDLRFLVYSAKSKKLGELATDISPIPVHFTYHKEHLSGLLVDLACKLQIPGLLIECGQHTKSTTVTTALLHLQKICTHFGMLDEKDLISLDTSELNMSFSNGPELITSYETFHVIKPGPDFKFTQPVEKLYSGMKVSQGEVYGIDNQKKHTAERDCYLMMPSKIIRPNDADAGWLCDKSTFQKLKEKSL